MASVLALNAEASTWVRSMVGPSHRIDLTFCGGEHIAIDDKRSLRVLHVPGHSDGHLAIYDSVNPRGICGRCAPWEILSGNRRSSLLAASVLFGACLPGDNTVP